MAEEEVKVADVETKEIEEKPEASEEVKEANGTTAEQAVEKDDVEAAVREENRTRNDQNDEGDVGDENHEEEREEDEEEDHSQRKSKPERSERSESKRESYRPKKNYKENIKFDPSVREESNDPEEIRKQVEFYFSESNIVRDKFLFNQVGGSKNRPIPISVIHSFKRMRRFQPLSAVIAALEESELLEVVNGDEVKRKKPLPEDIGTKFDEVDLTVIEDEAMARSIYAKGFGMETATTQYDIENFFEPYGPVRAVRLRRNDQKWFKGSVFVEFEDEETMKAFMDLNPKPTWNDNELLIKTKKDYCEGKVEDIKAGRVRRNDRFQHRGRYERNDRYKNNDRRHGDRRDRDYRPYRGKDRKGRHDEPSRYRDGGERDEDDWKGRREDFQSRGFKDKEADDEKEDQGYHENGIPKVKATHSPPNKRAREDGEAEEPTAKKSKPEVSAEA